MRTADEIRKEFEDNKQRQGDVCGAIQIKQRELLQLQGSQASLVAKGINKKNKSNSIKAGRSLVADLACECEELLSAKKLLEAEELQLQNELELSSLHQKLENYKEEVESKYFAKTDAVLEILRELNGVLIKLDEAVKELKQGVSPNFTLEKLLMDIRDKGISIASFWDGEVKPVDTEADNAFLSALRARYKAPMGFFSESAGVPRYGDVLNALASYWTLNSLDFIRQLKNRTSGSIGKFSTGETINHNTVVSRGEPTNRIQIAIANEKVKAEQRRRAARGIYESK